MEESMYWVIALGKAVVDMQMSCAHFESPVRSPLEL